jgi:hypothetical protein
MILPIISILLNTGKRSQSGRGEYSFPVFNSMSFGLTKRYSWSQSGAGATLKSITLRLFGNVT